MSAMWDAGVRWYLRQSAEQAPDWATDPLTVAFVRDSHLRAPSVASEDDYIDWLLKVSLREAERVTWRSLLPQSWDLVLDCFPDGAIVLPNPPLIAVTSITYLDEAGNEQSLSASPAWWQLEQPTGQTPGKAKLFPAVEEFWPATQSAANAVTVTFEAGYAAVDGRSAMPEDITHGRLLMIAELYKQRSESVRARSIGVGMATYAASALWKRYRVYGP